MKKNSALLFGGAAGSIVDPPKYSHAWAGMYPREDSSRLFTAILSSKTITEIYDKLDNDVGKDYRGVG